MILRYIGSTILLCLLYFAWLPEARLTATRRDKAAANIAAGTSEDDDDSEDDDGDDNQKPSDGSEDEWIPALLPEEAAKGAVRHDDALRRLLARAGDYDVVPASPAQEITHKTQTVQPDSATDLKGVHNTATQQASNVLTTSNDHAKGDDADTRTPPKTVTADNSISAQPPGSKPDVQVPDQWNITEVNVDKAKLLKLRGDRKAREDIETQLAHNRAKQEEMNAKLNKVSDPKFNAETDDLEKQVSEETDSPSTALMLQKMWKEIRKYNVPAYKEYLKQELADLKVEEAKLEEQIGNVNAKEADDKAEIDKEENINSIQVPLDDAQIGDEAP
jgi:hypothetical protein